MIQDVSEQMFQVFSQRMRSELESAAAPAAPSPLAPAGPSIAASAPGPSQALQTRPAAAQEALDLGSLGARVALRRPEVWIALIAIAVVVYLMLR
jgi:hypothetical protein